MKFDVGPFDTHSPAWLRENSKLSRLGLKGPQAATWLQHRNMAVPEQPNSWRLMFAASDEDLIIRLGASEYFLEHDGNARGMSLANELASPVTGVYPVLREDRALVLGGAAANDVLAQICSFDFDALPNPSAAVMTMMIGVAVIVVPQGNAAQRRYRIWCDPSFGDYLQSSLFDVVRDTCNQSE